MGWCDVRDWVFAPCYWLVGTTRRAIAREFVCETIRLQKRDAARVALVRQADVYVYDANHFFANARQESVDNIRYFIADDKLAVLSTVAQRIMRDSSEYLQYNIHKSDVHTDAIGVRVLLGAALEQRVCEFRDELRTSVDRERLHASMVELKSIIELYNRSLMTATGGESTPPAPSEDPLVSSIQAKIRSWGPSGRSN